MSTVRAPAVAGSFYPGSPQLLAREVDQLLAAGGAGAEEIPKALIVPHAGYIYSGPTAACAYRILGRAREAIHKVVLLGPAHRVWLRGLALPQADFFLTPLGPVAIDRAQAAAIADLPQVVVSDQAHAQEHSLEVQLPFLQRVLDDFSLLPLVVGQANDAQVAEVLDRLWGGPETLIVVSSDLSHYHAYDEAQRRDRASADAVLACGPALDHEQACGATPINGLLRVARVRGLRAQLLDLRNSGDTAGERGRVVGYAAFAFHEGEVGADEAALGRSLLARARAAIAREFGIAMPVAPGHRALARPGATFVTLTRAGALRGCIGSLQARRTLAEDVEHNARAAAFDDPRFAPLAADELPDTRIEVSLLSAPEALEVASEAEALRAIRPGADGLIFEWGAQRATFLPQVWESLPEAGRFLAELRRKAGLAADFWHPDVKLSRYRVRKWKEPPA